MKKKTSPESAFFNPRALLGLVLCLLGVTLAIFAFSALTGRSVEAQGTSQNGSAANSAATDYAGPPTDRRHVKPIRSRPLRDMKAIHPSKAPGHDHPEPIRPRPPTESGDPAGPIQTALGPVYSAPTAVGSGWDGVGVGLAGFRPSSNPPDVNGRVGATQYVQWNNTSFAIFDKDTGALQYGPAAGNTLFQPLGGLCASHNDGDPVVSYDILAGRWVLSQFLVGGRAGATPTSASPFLRPPTRRAPTTFTISLRTGPTSSITRTPASGRTATT